MNRAYLTALALLATPAVAQTNVPLQPGETLLEVQAQGTARYRPDAAFLSVGVVSTGATAREATDANARVMTAVLAAMRTAGVVDRYLRTQQINVQPRFARAGPTDYEGQAQITGYVARNSVAVTVVKLDRAPDAIAAAFAAGANSVNGPNLGSENDQTGLAEARADAIAHARAEAMAYADGFGLRVGRVLRISERGNYANQAIYVTGSRSFAAAPPAPPPPVEGGNMERHATLWVDYALTPK